MSEPKGTDIAAMPEPASFAGKLLQIAREARPGARRSQLPARVQAAIVTQDQSSEILIKIIQLTVVTIFGILYFVSPKTDAGTSFTLVPIALGLYLILNVIGLVWAVRWGLPNWSVYLSILFDTGLLMALIWSFHIQYHQPPSFYLKAPTFLYLFIFIALRALRFQARFVAATGLVAALGWLAMIAYVVMADPHNSMITRNYVTYLTSNAILLGAEFDKIIAILMVTAILALALVRARGLLVRASSDQIAARELSRFFDADVAHQIRSAEEGIAAGQGIKRMAAVLNVDIRGFTVMAADADPGEVMATLAAYQRRLVPLIQGHGGTIDKFLGDGIMATFGAVTVSDTYAADALAAVDAIMRDIASWPSEEPRLARLAQGAVNAAVASGSIVFGAVGDDQRLEYTVIGAAVNFSAKLEKSNKDLGTRALTTREAWDQAARQGYAGPAGAEQIHATVGGTGEAHNLVILYR